MKKLWTTIALILGMMGILTACGSSKSSLSNRDEDVQRYAWPLATASPEDTVTQLYAEVFVDEVTRLSDGKVKIQIYPNSTLGGDRELLESCQDGDIPFVIQNTAPQMTFMPDIAVFDIPCRFDNIEEVRAKVDDEKFYSLIEKV